MTPPFARSRRHQKSIRVSGQFGQRLGLEFFPAIFVGLGQIAAALSDRTGRRLPNDQGFDEWYGIPRNTDEAMWPGSPGYSPNIMPPAQIMEGRKGEPSRDIKIYDLEQRRLIDAEITRRSIAFMERQVHLSLAGSASASTIPTADIPKSDNISPNQRLVLSEEEMADVSLATFHLFDKENAGSDIQLAWVRGCRGCRVGGCRVGGCGGCGVGGCCARWGACRIC